MRTLFVLFYFCLVPEIETCPQVGRLLDSFGDFKLGLTDLRTQVDALKSRFEEELKECKEEVTAVQKIHTDLQKLNEDVTKYTERNQKDFCFLQVFDEVFCHH